MHSLVGNCDILNIVVHRNMKLSDVIVCDILDSDHLPTEFHILDDIQTKNLLEPFEKFRLRMGTKPFF